MKNTVKLLVAACVILSTSAAFADVTLIAKNDSASPEVTNQDQRRYESEVASLDAESSSILATLGGNRQPASSTNAGTKSQDGYTVTLMKVKRK